MVKPLYGYQVIIFLYFKRVFFFFIILLGLPPSDMNIATDFFQSSHGVNL